MAIMGGKKLGAQSLMLKVCCKISLSASNFKLLAKTPEGLING
jgi:hypothetical protein